MSFTLSAAGRELLIDPGTFAYHTQKKWRGYFRGTAAHNTVRVDREDQSVSGGNFLWTAHANARVLEHSGGEHFQRLLAEHDGYMRLADPVRHRRELRFRRVAAHAATLTVVDEMLCTGAHEIELFWHFPEHCHIEQRDSRVIASHGPTKLTMTLPDAALVEQANRCMDCGTPFCHGCGCPLANVIAQGNAHAQTSLQMEPAQNKNAPNRKPQFPISTRAVLAGHTVCACHPVGRPETAVADASSLSSRGNVVSATPSNFVAS